MSVNIYDGTNLIPIAGKTVPAPTPDYVDSQYSSSTTYSKGMTCIEGNVRYRYINSTASSGHQPPNATYWEVLSVSDELKETETLLWSQTGVTATTDYNSLTIDVSSYRKLKVKMFSVTTLYGGEIVEVLNDEYDLSDIASNIGSDAAFEFGNKGFMFDEFSYAVYFYTGNKTRLAKVTIWRFGTASDRSLNMKIYGIK